VIDGIAITYAYLGLGGIFILTGLYAWLELRGSHTSIAAGMIGWLVWPAALALVARDVLRVRRGVGPLPRASVVRRIRGCIRDAT
jgi:hypothetical protein